jgi:hypothetical protein
MFATQERYYGKINRRGVSPNYYSFLNKKLQDLNIFNTNYSHKNKISKADTQWHFLKRWTHFDHGVDVAFRSSELGGIFDPYEDDKIKIMPHVVLVVDVILEADGLIVELGATRGRR